jgi:hypothetical protein
LKVVPNFLCYFCASRQRKLAHYEVTAVMTHIMALEHFSYCCRA